MSRGRTTRKSGLRIRWAIEPRELKIDAAAVGREVLQQRQPEEDLDEGLLRSCKQLYGDTPVVLEAMQHAFTALEEQNGVVKLRPLRDERSHDPAGFPH